MLSKTVSIMYKYLGLVLGLGNNSPNVTSTMIFSCWLDSRSQGEEEREEGEEEGAREQPCLEGEDIG